MHRRNFFGADSAILLVGWFFIPSLIMAQPLSPQLLYQKNGQSPSDNFGWTVAGLGDIDMDGKADFIIGAPGTEIANNTDAGTVYIYSGQTGTVLYQKDGSGRWDQFGYSLAKVGDIDGDGATDFIVGAPFNFSASVYSSAAGELLYQETGSTGLFGFSTGGAGDINGDGKPDFMVGAPYVDGPTLTFLEIGEAYVFSGATGSLLFSPLRGFSPFEHLGWRVGGVGDIDGDGRDDFFVSNVGETKVYSGTTHLILQEKPGNRAMGIGDIDGDGKDDFITGSPISAPNGRINAGSAFIYSGGTGTLLYQVDGDSAGDLLGRAVAGGGDVNGDGVADFIVGAPGTDRNGLTDVGSTYVYSGIDGSLLFQVNGGTPGDSLGWSVADAGDVNGDSRSDVIIGAPGADPGGLVDAGSVYVYGLVSTDVPEQEGNRPVRFELSQNYPNPFNPTTTIRYALPKAAQVELRIFNILGQEVRMLLDGEKPAGYYQIPWDGKDQSGRSVSTGIYLYQIKAGDFIQTKKMQLIK